jgi:predicted Zn-dependent peptidase
MSSAACKRDEESHDPKRHFPLANPARGQAGCPSKNPAVPDIAKRIDYVYRKTTLHNGIRIVTEMMSQVRSIAIGILIDAGPRDENPEQSGLAHLVEHVMFQGTSSRDAMQIARLMDMSGGQMGAFTARDYTCYFATVLDDYRTYALDLLGDILLNSTFPADNLEREKEAILREIDANHDAPRERVHTLLKTFAWSSYPLGWPIAGRPETVGALTREDVIYFVHEHYLPDRLIIAAAGNVEHEDFVAQVRDAFWRILGQSSPSTNTRSAYQAGVTIEHMPVSQAYFSLGLRACPYAHPDRYAVHILNNILGGGISSRLFRYIREERGLVYHIGSEYHAYRDDGMLVVEGSTAPEYLMPVLELTLAELWRLATWHEPIDDEELWKAKMQIRGQHLISGENTHTRMSRLATQELYFGQHISPDEILAQIEAVDGQMLQRLSAEALMDALDQVTIAVVGPEAPQHYGLSAIEELLASLQQTVQH